MTEGTPSRYCKWIARDDEGRPKCEHGWAKKTGPCWRCPERRQATIRRYAQSATGRAAKNRWNASDNAQTAKRRVRESGHGRVSDALYNLTRAR